MKVTLQSNIQHENDQWAAENRALFHKHHVLACNIIASPGAGKTAFLEAYLSHSRQRQKIGVIEGDLATANDTQRVLSAGAAAIQINTEGGCHLDAHMVHQVLPCFDLAKTDLLFIENVGNLVCPSAFDLGESIRMIVLSVAEGSDKPIKYPSTFFSAQIVVINKIDLLPFTDFDISRAERDILSLSPNCRIFHTCCRHGKTSGIQEIVNYFDSRIDANE